MFDDYDFLLGKEEENDCDPDEYEESDCEVFSPHALRIPEARAFKASQKLRFVKVSGDIDGVDWTPDEETTIFALAYGRANHLRTCKAVMKQNKIDKLEHLIISTYKIDTKEIDNIKALLKGVADRIDFYRCDVGGVTRADEFEELKGLTGGCLRIEIAQNAREVTKRLIRQRKIFHRYRKRQLDRYKLHGSFCDCDGDTRILPRFFRNRRKGLIELRKGSLQP